MIEAIEAIEAIEVVEEAGEVEEAEVETSTPILPDLTIQLLRTMIIPLLWDRQKIKIDMITNRWIPEVIHSPKTLPLNRLEIWTLVGTKHLYMMRVENIKSKLGHSH